MLNLAKIQAVLDSDCVHAGAYVDPLWNGEGEPPTCALGALALAASPEALSLLMEERGDGPIVHWGAVHRAMFDLYGLTKDVVTWVPEINDGCPTPEIRRAVLMYYFALVDTLGEARYGVYESEYPDKVRAAHFAAMEYAEQLQECVEQEDSPW